MVTVSHLKLQNKLSCRTTSRTVSDWHATYILTLITSAAQDTI